jgi:sugar/nucleoside kinase (ribokinase family)
MGAIISDLAVVGHFSIDTILLPTRTAPFVVVGGAVTYTSLIARSLGSTVKVYSRVGEDFPEAYLWWLKKEGVNVSNVHKVVGEKTTRFELCYNKDLSSRILTLKCKGSPLTVDDLPSGAAAKAIHIAPIANEISSEAVDHLKKCADVISLDPQGLVRSFDENGAVTNTAKVDNHILSLVNIYKSTADEIYALTGTSELKPAIKAVHDFGVETVIVTRGVRGALLSVDGAFYDIPACSSNVIVDPTGAGDVFIGAFLSEYLKQKESLWCAAVGCAAASQVLEGIGPTFFGKKEEIYQRAQSLYEKELKQ